MMELIQNITLEQIAALLIFVGGLYGGVKYLKKELKDGIILMLKDKFDNIDKKFEDDDNKIKALEDQSVFLFKAISLLLEDDLVILEHLRTSNNTGKIADQEAKVHKFLTEPKVGK